ncbi:DNA mismatch repair protein [Grosmannia clavigera kw1407]|uniref:DNA mismatch repair protein n=1 Tax=Grosmannia clavigera (strain kw1407 / UAMH 11150) TaxID=655863 RepID=F0XUW7_GROCL|nr:DNA mismatch repair protein [Grosmannia clavigera kw1407]EFW98852.1 DNA mismatch repair protein [Grosmannia clavigera kw1407]
MSIKALPADATRLLDASSLIVDPVGLVKELVDNAIDAHATSIEVLIAPNTIDKIEVRDDGHGILRADYDFLGRPGHTSKLTCLEDLRTRTSDDASLGFRGQGLAAATALGYVAITTRTRTDTVAATFRLTSVSASRHSGGIVAESLKPSPAPVGTSVTVTCLFSSFPVRRCMAMKDSARTLAAIKELLYGYAFARPQLRLTFKVFQKPQMAWKYFHRPTQQVIPAEADRCGVEMREATRVLFGNEVARQCQDVVVSAADLYALSAGGGQLTLAQSLPGDDTICGLVFQAFLPRPGVDLSKLALGGFVSVDGRPLSARHRGGIVCRLLALYRRHLARSTLSVSHQQMHINNAFIRLNIKCPAGSYDSNVESSKTDVLFVNEQLLCDAFERLCIRLYGAIEPYKSQPQSSVSRHATAGTGHVSGSQSILRQSSIIGMSSRPAVTPYSGPIMSLDEQHSASGGLVGRRTRLGVVSSSPRNEGQQTASAGVLQRGGRRHQLDAQPHAHLTPPNPGRGGCKRGLQTPPPSSPLRRRQGGRRGKRRAESPDHADLPGLVSNDAYRQTTISFGKPAGTIHDRRATVESSASSQESISAVAELATRPQGNMAAPELQTIQDATLAEKRMGAPVQESSYAACWDEAGLHTTGGRDNGQRSRRLVATRKPVYVLETDLAKLRKSFARYSSEGDRDGEFTCLSPEMMDISAVKRRLRRALASWLAKPRANQKGGTAVEIEFYLRRGLKGVANK